MEVRRGPGGEAGRLEADDPQLHGEVRLPVAECMDPLRET